MIFKKHCFPTRRQLIRNLEKYIVDYFKFIIKSDTVSSQHKFNTLLLLKDLMKCNAKKLVDYTEKKFLNRLYLLSSSESARNCLQDINPFSDSQWSAHFYQLNLEALGMWAENHKDSNPEYFKVADKLRTIGRLPIPEKYYNFPVFKESIVLRERYKGTGQIKR